MKGIPEIPQSWLCLALLVGLIVLRAMGQDTWITASISSIMGYLLGVKMEQGRKR